MAEGKSCARKTKIVCTIGPASSDPEILKQMALAGMDIVRINSGHCSIGEMLEYIEMLHELGASIGARIGVMLDLQGPRLRIGPMKGSSVELEKGREFTITTEQAPGDEKRASVSYQGITGDLSPGDRVFIDDGLIRMKVKEISGKDILCEVLEGGVLLEEKGMNFPDSKLNLTAFTERDRGYLEAGLKAGTDWVSQSFVRDPADVHALQEAINELGHDTPVLAKIEKAEAVQNIDALLQVADGIMVARGDLGVEMNAEDVPLVQKELIKKSLRAVKPVVTATQMLESMIKKQRPTRAEASDVANAILDGTDALMLSAETAIGEYPVDAVETMARIALRVEKAIDYQGLLEERGSWVHQSAADAIGYAACKIAADLKAKSIITITRSGYTARLIARYRPEAQILAASPDNEVIDSLSVVWGVKGRMVPLAKGLKKTISDAVETFAGEGHFTTGDLVIITGGFFDEKTGTTNMIRVHTVE